MRVMCKTLVTASSVLLFSSLVGCGGSDGKSGGAPAVGSDGASENADATAADDQSSEAAAGRAKFELVRLKDSNLLAKALTATFGLGMDESYDEIDADGNPISVIEKYRKTFGSTEGLRAGELVADVLNESSTSYMLALNILADTVGKRCLDAVSNASANRHLCRCDSGTDARATLQRAIPWHDFDGDDASEIVSHFSDVCRGSVREAVTALISSLAFAKRN